MKKSRTFPESVSKKKKRRSAYAKNAKWKRSRSG